MITIHSRSHRRLRKFVDWIKPDPATREIINKQASEIRSAILTKAVADGLSVIATPNSGSFAKHTGLRRHLRGNAEVEGQDVDLPFVVKPATKDGERIGELLSRFDGYAKASYPTTARRITGSSVELQFTASKLNYDLVPMLVSATPGYQLILKKNGDRRLTSVAKHTEFITKRTAESDSLPGRVKFNECVRLFKWWRCIRIAESGLIDEVRTTLIDLLCAKAYDTWKVESTYTETLLRWFAGLANITANRTTISFSDYTTIESVDPQAQTNSYWRVIDPVNANNNVVHTQWGNIELAEFAGWFASARDALNRLVAQEHAGNDAEVDKILSGLFGGAVLTHGELS